MENPGTGAARAKWRILSSSRDVLARFTGDTIHGSYELALLAVAVRAALDLCVGDHLDPEYLRRIEIFWVHGDEGADGASERDPSLIGAIADLMSVLDDPAFRCDRSRLPGPDGSCAHSDIVPISADWARCTTCGDDTFPLADDQYDDEESTTVVRVASGACPRCDLGSLDAAGHGVSCAYCGYVPPADDEARAEVRARTAARSSLSGIVGLTLHLASLAQAREQLLATDGPLDSLLLEALDHQVEVAVYGERQDEVRAAVRVLTSVVDLARSWGMRV